MATSKFMKEFYNGGFAPEFSVSMLKETIAQVRDYVSATKEKEGKLAGRYIPKRNMKSFSNETLTFSSSESSVSPTFWILRKLYELCKPFHRNSPETL